MNTRTLTAVGLLAATALLTACDPTTPTSSSTPATTAPGAVATAGDTPTGIPAPGDDDTKAVPKLVGMGLQAAQDAAQAAGFYNLTSHDSAGRDRMQLLDRDWKVCSQKPSAGTKAPTGTELDFGAVKTDESCPASDQKPPAKAGKTMPNLVGKGLNVATDALPSDASIAPTDASGQGRMILLESNWKICTQSPRAGAPLNGQPVTFGAVKFGESCP